MSKFWLGLSYYGAGILIYLAYTTGREHGIVRVTSATAFIMLGYYYRKSIEPKLFKKESQ